MRFDDKLATILAQPLEDSGARHAAWRQVVDVLAQAHDDARHPLSDEAVDLVRHLREQVPPAIRAEAARAIAGRQLSPAIVALIAEEPPAIAASLMGSARLEASQWLDLLPTLPAAARALLRHRRDLPSDVERGLASFGTVDFVLSASEGALAAAESADAVTPDGGETQIRDLLARIAAFREKHGPIVRDTPPEAPAPSAAIEDFRFETGPDGVIVWVEGAPRGPLIGETIATVATHIDRGVDGHAAGAYRQRAPFRDARLSIAGDGSIAGEWRISAVPFFDPVDGRFTGYRGTARRPRPDERAETPGGGAMLGAALAPDSLRQLVHELRTPLNAIVGFAEMIERQMLGPAGHEYRSRAGDISEQGRRLLAAVDDLDMAARIESRRIAHEKAAVDAVGLLARLHADHEKPAAERGVQLAFTVAAGVPPIEADPIAVERMFARLLAATIGLAGAGETTVVKLDHSEGTVRLSVARPKLLEGRDERALLDPGYSPDGDWPDAPLLGLGFALRLVRNLAAGVGGALDIVGDSLVLRLPAACDGALTGSSNG